MEYDKVVNADCIEWMESQPEPFADLIFADPPFNIGFTYDVYVDSREYQEYYDWTKQWMNACGKVLKPTGTFWVAIGAEYAAEVRMIGREMGLSLRNWIIWYYTFGQSTRRKFARSHTHLFYFTKDPAEFTFNDEAIRTFSDRQRVYRDKRANRRGKIPDDVWTEFPRLCGTFGEREGWHPCQMPETILGRIVRACSNVGDVVFDPFAGSGTSLAVAKKYGRRYVGTELSENYVENVRKRLAEVAPTSKAQAGPGEVMPPADAAELAQTYAEAAVTTETLRGNPHLLEAFTGFLNGRLSAAGAERSYGAEQVWGQLEQLRASLELPKIRVHAEESTERKPRPLPEAKGKKTETVDGKMYGALFGTAE